jgi:enoyl-CoA hydratase/carnithine racemase
MREADDDPGVRAIVLTAAGERSFCVGMDLKAFSADPTAFSTPDPDYTSLIQRGVRTPVVGAAPGVAVGGGLELLLTCDLLVLADSARVGLPEVTRGLLAAGGGTRLATRIPQALALELALTGELVPAARALEIGLVNRVVPGAALRDTALELAGRIARNGPLAVTTTKRLVLHAMSATPEQAWAEIDRSAPAVFASQDAKEGAAAFVERRAPAWVGR